MIDKYVFDGKKFGERLKSAIKSAGYTQEQFANELDTNVTTIRSYFDGTMPKADKILNIARALNTTVEYLLTGDEVVNEENKPITPKDISNAINILTEAYGYDCIEEKEFTEVFFDGASGYPRNTTVKHNAICINEDKKVQWYLQQLRTKGHLKFELSSVGESEAYSKLLKQWANIDGCIFENGFIYNPQTEEICKDEMGNLYIDEKLPF